MECPEINNGCPKLKELNAKAENLDRVDRAGNLSLYGISKHNGSYVHSLCLSDSYKNCVMRK